MELNRSSLRIGRYTCCPQQSVSKKCFGVIRVSGVDIPINEAITENVSTEGNCTKCKKQTISLLGENIDNMPAYVRRRIDQYSGM